MIYFRWVWPLVACCCWATAWAEELEVRNAWIREAPPVAKSHAAYMELVNKGDLAINMTSVFAADYGMTMLHKTVEKNGMATMEHVDVLSISPGQMVKLEPGGLHMMLMNPKRALKAGDTVKMILVLDGGRQQEVMVSVRGAK